ncbi:CHASE3 domain sensor protein [Pseudomonas sp. JUb42]|uniref:CHASE3 domain-containing protein n=1 Tax=Pseudomonas sp. JUb42 TaxID=2940611 RepID=UPI0021675FF6|nr:CHASE3 domain-containing protein [Pseudomonas sp. JUb42]MCS3473095.1 CHASE3 domain sensor protein [Pseudomonas sp. JUb42]
MSLSTAVDEKSFRKILKRNITFPVVTGIFSAVLFVALISYLLDEISWVEHSDKVINTAHETQKLAVDMESGLHGYLLSADERYLDVYDLARTRVPAGLKTLGALAADNTSQLDRLQRIGALQEEWAQRAVRIIEIRHSGGAYEDV